MLIIIIIIIINYNGLLMTFLESSSFWLHSSWTIIIIIIIIIIVIIIIITEYGQIITGESWQTNHSWPILHKNFGFVHLVNYEIFLDVFQDWGST